MKIAVMGYGTIGSGVVDVLRINKESHLMTVHLMRDIDLFSAFANFEINYEESVFEIKNYQEKVIINKK